MYEVIRNYLHNDSLRASFNALAEATFGLNFEGWYQNGFWGDDYNPYSIVLDGKVVANVSVNRTDMVIGGQRKRMYQLGTVMTAPEYRGRGLIRAIMAEVERDIGDADGIYLFANDSVLDFYPKFGFRRGAEFICAKEVRQTGENRLIQVPMTGPEAWSRLRKAMDANVFHGGCGMVDNPGLVFFYVSQFMQESAWYSEELDAWAIADLEDRELCIHDIFCGHEISLDEIIAAFGGAVRRVTLGFAPADPTSFEVRLLKDEDTTFFVKGAVFDSFERSRLRIPELSHA